MTDLPIGNRLMDRAWYRDPDDLEHRGEALLLACLLHVKKDRNSRKEEALKDLLGVYGEKQKKTNRRNKTHKKQ